MKRNPAFRHVLLDIEGTTCPVNFVGEVLFPYASRQLRPYLKEHQRDEPIKNLLQEVEAEMGKDPVAQDPSAAALLHVQGSERLERICLYLESLIRADRKFTPLKDLQGKIWEEGYRRRELIAPLFTDVPDALQRWRARGLELSVYSSGSVHAQKLLYAHTETGDLRHLFSHWFDTRIGAKNTRSSYESIAAAIGTKPQETLFVSDAIAELQAANEAGMEVVFSQRPGNPHQDSHGFPCISSFTNFDPPVLH